MRRAWTLPERRRAVELRAQGNKYEYIGAVIGRSGHAVAAHLRALRLEEERRA